MRRTGIISLAVFLSMVMASCLNNSDESDLPDGKLFASGCRTVEFSGYAPLSRRPIEVCYNIPAKGDMSTMPVLFVLPGLERNADDYLASWKSASESKKFMVFVLRFPKETYSTDQYTEGGMFENGKAVSREDWTFSIIEPLFEAIRKDTGSRRSAYDMWGHSAGAQFVHRFVTFMPDAHVDRAVAANAGWYTVPSLDIEYPYGLRGSGFADQTTLDHLFSTELIVQLGTADESRDGLNTSAGADAQGLTRYARGNNYFNAGERISSEKGIPFRWIRSEVEGVGHNQAKMAAAAASLLY